MDLNGKTMLITGASRRHRERRPPEQPRARAPG